MDEPTQDPQPELTEETLRDLREWALTYVRSTFPDLAGETVERYAEQILQGIRWVQEKWGSSRQCPYCGNPGWAIGIPVELLTEPLMPDKPVAKLVPVFPVVCTNCGNTVLVSAPYAGVGKAKPKSCASSIRLRRRTRQEVPRSR
jgi:hypothetical protein